MKKSMIAIGLMGVIAFGCLTGCGKKEEIQTGQNRQESEQQIRKEFLPESLKEAMGDFEELFETIICTAYGADNDDEVEAVFAKGVIPVESMGEGCYRYEEKLIGSEVYFFVDEYEETSMGAIVTPVRNATLYEQEENSGFTHIWSMSYVFAPEDIQMLTSKERYDALKNFEAGSCLLAGDAENGGTVGIQQADINDYKVCVFLGNKASKDFCISVLDKLMTEVENRGI